VSVCLTLSEQHVNLVSILIEESAYWEVSLGHLGIWELLLKWLVKLAGLKVECGHHHFLCRSSEHVHENFIVFQETAVHVREWEVVIWSIVLLNSQHFTDVQIMDISIFIKDNRLELTVFQVRGAKECA
jgi:hypothetical protein